ISGPTAGQPLVSGDGSITGHAIYTPCAGSCMIYYPRTNFYLQGAGFPSITSSTLQISRNGRFLLASVFVPATLRFEQPLIIELPSQAQRPLPQLGRAASSRQAIANDGSAVFLYDPPSAPLEFAPIDAPSRNIPRTEGAVSAIISPNGGLIAYERETVAGRELVLTDPEGSTHRVLASAPSPFAFNPSFANDGTLLYLDAQGQPVVLAPGSEPRQLIALDGGARNAIISGNGQLVWLATSVGQLLRVRTIDGVADEVIPASPLLSSRYFYTYPGSVIRLQGLGLSRDTQVTLAETPLVLAEINSRESVYQIPWEYAPSTPPLALTVRGTNSPFGQEIEFTLAERPTIRFERAGQQGILQAAHDDFRGVVTQDDPARPGETIHVFASNMGPVDQPVATGQISPSSPPARVTTPFACYFHPAIARNEVGPAVGLDVPFAGLSGGSIGVYQIDVTIPSSWNAPDSLLSCRMGNQGDSANVAVSVR
ncbi:MAG: hypothetical protein ABI972_13990, partial [Acidobacteriota bacterium]